jgi:hypothetical protein
MSQTVSFSYPLVNITTSNAGYRLSNYLTYAAAGINTFCTFTLDFHLLTLRFGPGMIDQFKVPWTESIVGTDAGGLEELHRYEREI